MFLEDYYGKLLETANFEMEVIRMKTKRPNKTLWSVLNRLAKTAQNREPKPLIGNITYRKAGENLVIDIPVSFRRFYDGAKATVSVIFTDTRRIVFFLSRFKELYEHPDFIRMFYDITVDKTHVSDKLVSLEFDLVAEQDDLDAELEVQVVFEFNLGIDAGIIYVGLLESEWNFEVLGEALWEVVQDL